VPANPHQIAAAETMLGLRLHGHQSHGHSPYPSHNPPRQSQGGWWPPGTGPFRPGPGAPSFGARMPISHRPGISFGPAHHGRYNPGHGYGWNGRGVNDFSQPEHTPVGIGSHQRWHSVTHMGRTSIVGGKLTTPEIQQLKTMMINALGPTRVSMPFTPQQSAAAKLLNRQLQGTTAANRLTNLLAQPVNKQTSDKSVLERYLFLAPAAAQAAADYRQHQQDLVNISTLKSLHPFGAGGGSAPSGGGPGSPGFDASANLNVNLPPPPSASASLNAGFKI
jgi:hypothetical protein